MKGNEQQSENRGDLRESKETSMTLRGDICEQLTIFYGYYSRIRQE